MTASPGKSDTFILSMLADFCRLLITFANSVDPDQDWQNVSPDLDLKEMTAK